MTETVSEQNESIFKDKSKELENFLKGLSEADLKPRDLEELYNQAYELYGDGWRHSYSFITKNIMKQLSKKPLNGVLSLNDTCFTIYQNINIIKEVAKRILKGNFSKEILEKNKNLYKSLSKLADHIELEFVRIDFIQNRIGIKDLDAADISKRFNDLENKLKDMEQDVQDQKTNIIVILGIFAAIVTTVGASIGFSGAIFTNLDKIQSSVLVLVIFLVALFNVNLLGALFYFILKVKTKIVSIDWKLIITLNLVLGLLAAGALFWVMFDLSNSVQVTQYHGIFLE